MAQELDNRHRDLEERSQQLKIEYISQESDANLLIKQILYYRKLQRQLEETKAKFKAQVEENKRDDELQDRMLASHFGSEYNRPNSGDKELKMPSIMHRKKKSVD